MLRQCFLKAGWQYGHTWLVTYLFLSFNSDSIDTVCLSWNVKVSPKISQFGRDSVFFLVIFDKLLRACFIFPRPARLKIFRVRSILNDVSIPFASCPPIGHILSIIRAKLPCWISCIGTREELIHFLSLLTHASKIETVPPCKVRFS